MTNYYLFIDESGQFKSSKEKYSSHVSGFLTKTDPDQIIAELKRAIKKFEPELTIRDIHAAEVLHPEEWIGKRESAKKYLDIEASKRKDFIETIAKLLDKHTVQYFKAENKSFDFGKDDPQARYGTCLIALFQSIGNYLKNKKGVLVFDIEHRNRECLPPGSDHKKYHSDLKKYFLKGYKKLKDLKCSIYENNPKLMLALADVTCYKVGRNKYPEKTTITSPNDLNISDYAVFQKDFFQELLDKGEIATAYRQAKNEEQQKEALKMLEKMESKKSLEIQAISLIDFACDLIDKRNQTKDAMSKARDLLDNLKNLSLGEKEQVNINNALILCANYSGNTGIQDGLEQEISEQLEKQYKLSELVRYTQILEIRNRALGGDFNKYNFERVVDFEKEEEKYRKVLQMLSSNEENPKDYLLAKIQSNLGRAYAFLSAGDQEYFEEAEKYFKKSIEETKPQGIQDDKRTENFLLQLYVYFEKKDNLIELYERYHDRSIDDLPEKIFDILTFLKVYSCSQESFDYKTINQWANKIKNNNYPPKHPLPLIYKWLALLLVKSKHPNALDQAISLLKKGIEICSEGGFTLQTIKLSLQGLILALKDQAKESINIKEWKVETKSLMAEEAYFEIYVQEKGGLEKWEKQIENCEVDQIKYWLPFTYS